MLVEHVTKPWESPGSGTAILHTVGGMAIKALSEGHNTTLVVRGTHGWEEAPMREIKTGGIQMIPIAGGYKVWTKRFGSGSIPMRSPLRRHAPDSLPNACIGWAFRNYASGRYRSDRKPDPKDTRVKC